MAAGTTIERALAAGDSAKKKLYEIMARSAKTAHTAKAVAEVAGAAFAHGVAAGRYGANGELAVMGVPVDLASGVLAVGLGVSGLAGDAYSDDITNLGIGSLSYWASRTGVGVGQTLLHSKGGTAALGAPAPATSGTSRGYIEANGGYPSGSMSPDQMQAMAAAAHR
ncbi:MAG: hypothetical protein ACHREM_12190 [Polyangiales bacterium]